MPKFGSKPLQTLRPWPCGTNSHDQESQRHGLRAADIWEVGCWMLGELWQLPNKTKLASWVELHLLQELFVCACIDLHLPGRRWMLPGRKCTWRLMKAYGVLAMCTTCITPWHGRDTSRSHSLQHASSCHYYASTCVPFGWRSSWEAAGETVRHRHGYRSTSTGKVSLPP